MLDYPCIRMPEVLTRLLRRAIHSSPADLSKISLELSKDDTIISFCKSHFKDIHDEGSLDRIILTLGWQGFRDRLTCIYIDYYKNKHFESEVNKDHVKELLLLEDKVSKFTVSGYSRTFMLGLYLKLSLIHYSNIRPNEKFQNLLISSDLIEYLNITQRKTVKIDWLLLLLNHFHTYLGADVLHSCIKKNIPFNKMILELEQSQKEALLNNLLAYGFSINEPQFFSELII